MKLYKILVLSFVFSFSYQLKATVTSRTYGIILGGGSGKRLWPLSRMDLPKQFIIFDQNKSLIELTRDRLIPIVPVAQRIVVTVKDQAVLIKSALGNSIGKIISEPAGRNTAPAVMLTLLELAYDPDAIVIFVPADHAIPNAQAFVESINQAVQAALSNDRIILLGIEPTYPATGYGYIEYKESFSLVKEVKKFHEKPALDQAERYLNSGNFLWNSGMLIARVSTLLSECRKHTPELINALSNYKAGQADYEDLPSIAFDCAVLEKSEKCSVLKATFEWSDVGNLEVFVEAQKITKDPIVSVHQHNSLTLGVNKLIALVGVDNLCIVETDDVLLIANRNEVEKVKDLVEKLQKDGYQGYL